MKSDSATISVKYEVKSLLTEHQSKNAKKKLKNTELVG